MPGVAVGDGAAPGWEDIMRDPIDDLLATATAIRDERDQMQVALAAALEHITKLEAENAALRRYREGL
jgi:predicted metal-dependent hydrolase